jgi:hypothetical protein
MQETNNSNYAEKTNDLSQVTDKYKYAEKTIDLPHVVDNSCYMFVLFCGLVFQQTISIIGILIRIVLRYLLIYFYMLMRQTSFQSFSRMKIENYPSR